MSSWDVDLVASVRLEREMNPKQLPYMELLQSTCLDDQAVLQPLVFSESDNPAMQIDAATANKGSICLTASLILPTPLV